MARLIYWCVYNLDLGPFGPTALNLAPRVWHQQAKRRSRWRARPKYGFTGRFGGSGNTHVHWRSRPRPDSVLPTSEKQIHHDKDGKRGDLG
jgi:hypothetical protein